MHPLVSLLFFSMMVYNVAIALITKQVIWLKWPAFHRDYHPFFYWLFFWGAVVAGSGIALYCWRDWLRFLA